MIIQGNTRYIGTEILNEVAKRKKQSASSWCHPFYCSHLVIHIFRLPLWVELFSQNKNIILKLKINCNMLVIVWFTLLQLSVQTLLQSLLRVFHLSLEIYEISLQKFFIALAWQFLRYALL